MNELKKYLEMHFFQNYLGKIDLSQISYLKTGGKACHCLLLHDERSMEAFERHVANKIPYCVLGRGSNTLISDEGVHEVIVFVSPTFDCLSLNFLEKKDNHMIFPAGLSLAKAFHLSHRASLGGLEFSLGIPGSIGGAVRMNAGADGFSTSDFLTHAFIFRNGCFKWVAAKSFEFCYRHSNIAKQEIVICAAFLLNFLDSDQIKQKRAESLENLKKRKKTQPLGIPSLGSTFKNPNGYYAAKLIEQSGLCGLKRGGISISQKHANFLHNDGNGTSRDALEVIKAVEEVIYKRFSIQLEREIILLGQF